MKLLVALVVALALTVADARIKRLFGSQDGQVRVYTALGENSASAADGDCFIGKCPFDVSMPFMMGDVCQQIGSLTAPASADDTVNPTNGNINLQNLFYEFFRSTNCPLKLTELFGTRWTTYTQNLEVPVYLQFIEAGVMGGSFHKQCPADRLTCGNHPNGVVRVNFIFDNFCSSTCVLSPTPSPSAAVPVSPPPPASPITPGPPGPAVSPGSSPAPPGPPGPGPVIATGLGPVIEPGQGVQPTPPAIIDMPNPPPIVTGVKDVVSAGSVLEASIGLLVASLAALLL
eukprot:CAMPEP_0177648700 /NCGR_PEP_ID=MMETSP0447-20121125/10967_1 /TAXON_ID=0 /ORGANISM="Stygamoeba regulata, Strain BSH-02190019" /LENGTH=286 /DNA_ID=CAMNT_0019151357 /DNA_START=92 /DNA_END=952 /DNA_ORIENTATION=+